jgi:CubicO group peptidase (beta-lactamase class C family)
MTEQLENLLKSTKTSAFIVIQNDHLLYEKYFNGYSRDSVVTSFSMAKSFASALIGMAIDEGHIQSVDDPITQYIPELKSKGMASVTIRDLLKMSSGIKYREGLLMWGDDAKTYYASDLRSLALNEVKLVEEPGKFFWYNNYNPLLIGIILERATNTPVSQYLQEKLWKPLGMEFPASWSTDSKEHGFEKMESGINARAIDYAKFGRLFLNLGQWEGNQIISEQWVKASTQPNPEHQEYYRYYDGDSLSKFFHTDHGYYQYFWWGYQRNKANYDFFAMGKYGQYIYISPSKNLIIVRTGEDWGKMDEWHKIFYDMASKL